MVAALTRVGFEVMQLDRIEIHCDVANARSSAVPERLGYRLEATLGRRVPGQGGEPRDAQIWTLFAHEYPESPSAGTRCEARDALGRVLL